MCKLFALLENDSLYTGKEPEIELSGIELQGGQLTPSFQFAI